MSDTTQSDSTRPSPVPSADLPAVPKRRRWLVALVVLVFFASGFVLGVGSTLIVVHNRVLYLLEHPEQGPSWMTARLRWKLDLSDEQAEQIERILRTRQANMQAIRRDMWPRVEVELDLAEKQVADVLDAPQREKWHAHFAKARRILKPPFPDEDGAKGERATD